MNKGNIATQRQSNIELLRVISMFMVLLGHYYVLSYFDSGNTISFNLLGMQFLGAWSKVAVDIFVIITGYFLVNQIFRWNKVLKLLSCTYFWGIIILLLGLVLGLSIKTDYIYKSIFPLTPLNWFARSYLLLYVSIPLFNKIINSVSKARLGQIIIALTTIFYTIPTLISTFISGGGYLTSYFTFGIMYMIGAYIRKYGDEKLDKISIYTGIMSIILILASILWNDIHMHEGLYIMYLAHKGNSVVGLLAAIGIFTIFKNIKISYSPFINTLASTTFAVYLIHNNPIISDWLWNTVVQANNYFDSPFYLLHMVSITTLIFVFCSMIELIRLNIFNRYYKYN
jgi:hypothetical protein